MKVALINSRLSKPFNYKTPLGLAYMAAILEKNNIENIILYGEDYSNLEELKNELKTIKPDILGISVMTRNLDYALKIAKCAKNILPDIKIIFGGPHPTVQAMETIKHPEVDIICIGEGEFTLLEIAQEKELQDIKGIVFRKGKKIIKTQPRDFIKNLDSLPLPNRDKLKMSKHLKSRTPIPIRYPATTLIASRGCPGNCLFCQPVLRNLFGIKPRYRSVNNVINEMIELKSKYKLTSLYFNDNELTSNREWILKFCDELIHRKIKIAWACASRVDNLDEEVVKKLKKAGCYFLTLGVESGSQKILDAYRKGINIKQIINAYDLCRKYKILTFADFMIGAIEETEEDVNKTITLIKRIKADFVMVNVTTPIVGTDLFAMAKKQNRLCEKDLHNIERHNLRTMKREYLSEKDIKRLMKKVFNIYRKEIIKIFINPIQWFKRFHTIKGITLYWIAFLKRPKLIYSGIKWYFETIFVRNVKSGKRL